MIRKYPWRNKMKFLIFISEHAGETNQFWKPIISVVNKYRSTILMIISLDL